MPDHATSRRSFLARLGFGAVAVAATAVVPNAVVPKPEAVQPSLRPKCPTCSTLMVIRYEWRTLPESELSKLVETVGYPATGR